tara:strand:- start:1515 stop:1742 length:228 start_codon:yes stop_codon:yes gene_type:complete
MGGFFDSPSIPDREPDPELARLKAEEDARLKKLKEAAAEKKKRFAAGMMGPRSLMRGGYTGFPTRTNLGDEEFVT